ncbi:MAG TPA: hypothetical protein VIL13_02480 [Longimicrobiales bacterium]|jgi:hypothetical protein
MKGERETGGGEARPEPYELVFGGPFEAEWFPATRAEAEARGIDPATPDTFLLLAEAGRALAELVPEGAGEAVVAYGRLLYQAYHYWLSGKRRFVLEAEVARRLVEGGARVGEWVLTPPHPAGYLQFPRYLFWARVREGAPPEPVDGLFWTMAGGQGEALAEGRRVDVLLVLGLMPGRPGFSTIEVEAEVPVGGPGHWADVDARPEGRDFENILPGGELQGYYALTTPAEVLKLLSLVFWYMAMHPASVGEDGRIRLVEDG